jgi:hypothetical protein
MPIELYLAFIAATVILVVIPGPNVARPRAMRISVTNWPTADADALKAADAIVAARRSNQ